MFKLVVISIFLFGLFLAGCDHDLKSRFNNQNDTGNVVTFNAVMTQKKNCYDGNNYNISQVLVVETGYLNQNFAYAAVVCTDTSVKKWCVIIINKSSINSLSRGDLVNFNGRYYGCVDIVVKDKNKQDITLRPPAFLVNAFNSIEHSYTERICDQSGNEIESSHVGFNNQYCSTIFTPNFLDLADWSNPFSPAFDINPMKSLSPYNGSGSLNAFDDDF